MRLLYLLVGVVPPPSHPRWSPASVRELLCATMSCTVHKYLCLTVRPVQAKEHSRRRRCGPEMNFNGAVESL